MNCQPLWIRLVYNWLINNQSCLLCDERARTEQALCVACELELPWLGDRCQRCALPLRGWFAAIASDSHPPSNVFMHLGCMAFRSTA